jgi:hypothetical protein
MSDPETYLIGQWRFDVTTGQLHDAHIQAVKLEDRAARTLALLCRNAGRVVSREAILAEVWGGRAVSENSVAVVIADLRRALGSEARARIVTITKRGYRMDLTPPFRPPAPATRRHALFAGAAVVASLAVTGAIVIGRKRAASPVRIIVEPVGNETGAPANEPLARALSQVMVDRLTREKDVAVVDGRPEGQAALRLQGKLILWAGAPCLSLSAREIRTRVVIWSGMVEEPRDVLARATSRRLDSLMAVIRARRSSPSASRS